MNLQGGYARSLPLKIDYWFTARLSEKQILGSGWQRGQDGSAVRTLTNRFEHHSFAVVVSADLLKACGHGLRSRAGPLWFVRSATRSISPKWRSVVNTASICYARSAWQRHSIEGQKTLAPWPQQCVTMTKRYTTNMMRICSSIAVTVHAKRLDICFEVNYRKSSGAICHSRTQGLLIKSI